MSRFYDVLRQASRSQVGTDGEPHNTSAEPVKSRLRDTIPELSAVEEPPVISPLTGQQATAKAADLEAVLHSLLQPADPLAHEAETGSTFTPNGPTLAPNGAAATHKAPPVTLRAPALASDSPLVIPNSPVVAVNGSPAASLDSATRTVTEEPREAVVCPAVHLDPTARLIPNMADSGLVEYYRRLRTRILQQQETKPFRLLVVASASPQEGKTVTVLNLAFTMAMLSSFRVLVLDGDLRRGTVGNWFGIQNNPGLSDLIEGTARLEDVIVSAGEPAIHIMPRGLSKLAPAELLNSPDLGRHFRRIAEDFDLVLVDSPPLNLVTDTQLIANSCDAVLLVARAFSTTRKSLEQATHELNRFRVIGTVLNAGTKAQLYRRYGYY